jgi:hypothetical protein
MSAAMQSDEFHPAPGEALEDIDLGRVDHVFSHPSDHRLPSNP